MTKGSNEDRKDNNSNNDARRTRRREDRSDNNNNSNNNNHNSQRVAGTDGKAVVQVSKAEVTRMIEEVQRARVAGKVGFPIRNVSRAASLPPQTSAAAAIPPAMIRRNVSGANPVLKPRNIVPQDGRQIQPGAYQVVGMHGGGVDDDSDEHDDADDADYMEGTDDFDTLGGSDQLEDYSRSASSYPSSNGGQQSQQQRRPSRDPTVLSRRSSEQSSTVTSTILYEDVGGRVITYAPTPTQHNSMVTFLSNGSRSGGGADRSWAPDPSLQQESAVRSDLEIQGIEPVSLEELQRKRRPYCCIVSGIISLLTAIGVAVGVTVAVMLGSGGGGGGDAAVEERPTAERYFAQCASDASLTSIDESILPRYYELRSLILPSLYPAGLTVAETSCEPQNLALLQLATEGPSETVESRFLLIVLYQILQGSGWDNNNGWLSTSKECTWYGVSCSASGKVVGLTLGDNRVTGSLPTELGLMSTLRKFVVCVCVCVCVCV